MHRHVRWGGGSGICTKGESKNHVKGDQCLIKLYFDLFNQTCIPQNFGHFKNFASEKFLYE